MPSALLRFLESPANWFGMACAGLAGMMALTGFVAVGAVATTGLVVVAYLVGVGLGAVAFGLDAARRAPDPAAGALGDGRHRIGASLARIRALVNDNPQGRLKRSLREQIQALCRELDGLVRLLDDHRDRLSTEQAFRAEQLATRYLPDALKAYLAIPKAFAATERLDNGKTAQQTLEAALAEITGQTRALMAELMHRGAEGLVNQASFLEHQGRRSKPLEPGGG